MLPAVINKIGNNSEASLYSAHTRQGEGVGLLLVAEGVALQHTVGRQVHHIPQAALVAYTDMQSSQLCQSDIEQASFHLMVELVQLLAAGHMHNFADHTHQALLHDHSRRFALSTGITLPTQHLALHATT